MSSALPLLSLSLCVVKLTKFASSIVGAFFEWFASYLLIWPKNGVVMKEDLRTVYDGSLFFAVAEKESTTRSKQPFWAGFFNENRAGDIKRFKKIE